VYVEGDETVPTPVDTEKTGRLDVQEPSWKVMALFERIGRVQVGQKHPLKKFLQADVPLHDDELVKSLL